MLLNIVDILANWNFPNSCSIALDFCRGSRVSRASARDITVPRKFPALASTIPTTSMPKLARRFLASSVGLINLPRDDLSAFAPWAADIPPSLIAVRKKARSSTSPPKAFTTEPAFGIASLKSSIDRIVWFSAAFRKFTLSDNSSIETPKALVREMVVSRASSCSSPPKTDSLVACLTCASRASPMFPIWATRAARPTVFSTAIPYLVNSSASSLTFSRALSVSPVVVNMSP